MYKLVDFSIGIHDFAVQYLETQQVKEGVECDVYEIIGDSVRDLAIVRVKAGHKTPLQKVLKGVETIEGFIDGRATLTVMSSTSDSEPQVYSFDAGQDVGKEVIVQVGQIVQWTASSDADLTFYEICTPPYEDGRFEDLAE